MEKEERKRKRRGEREWHGEKGETEGHVKFDRIELQE